MNSVLRRLLVTMLLVCPLFGLAASSTQVVIEGGQERYREVVQTVFAEELDWRLSFDEQMNVVISDVAVDIETFPGFQLLTLQIAPKVDGETHRFTLAFLVEASQDPLGRLESELRAVVRQNIELWFPPLSPLRINHALPSGYWTLPQTVAPAVGQRLSVVDAAGGAIGLMVVADRFTYPPDDDEGSDVIEVLPIWASRPITEGMSLVENPVQVDLEIAPVFSLDRLGVNLFSRFPLHNSLLGLSLQADLAYNRGDRSLELLVFTGLTRAFSLGELARSPGRIGSWWMNLRVGVDTNLGVGVRMEDNGSADVLFGAKATLKVLHQFSRTFFWGVGAGYRYIAAIEAGSVAGIQGNERGITVSPILGWMW